MGSILQGSSWLSGDILCVFAMKQEAGSFFPLDKILCTGVGKVNATYALMKELSKRHQRGLPSPKLVLNFGTAGSRSFLTRTLVECTEFVQRDMDLTPARIPRGHTPYESTPWKIEVPKRFSDLPKGVCGSGDNFEVQEPLVSCDVIDMEAYALAKVCHFESIPFCSVKFITDGANSDAHADWSSNLPLAARSFADVYEQMVRKLDTDL